MDLFTLLSRHIISRIYSIKEVNHLFCYLKELENTQWLPFGTLKQKQLERLKKILVHAYETTNFYKKRFDESGFNPHTLANIDEMEKIPLLKKKEINENLDKMKSSIFSTTDLVKGATGGSTGTQLHFFINKESVDRKNACAWRHNRWAGWDIGIPVAALWGNPKEATTLKARLRRKILNRTMYLDTMHMTPETMHGFADEINRLSDYVVYGHSHSIYLFADFLIKSGLPIHSPLGIVTTSMMLMNNERQIIKEVFKTKVTDRYGCEEVSLISSECNMHDGMHLNLDHLIVEFIKADGTQAGPGEEGKIVVTDLTNYGMPFIRYEVGDVGIPTNRMCACGRGLPLMEKVIGRTADFLIRKDGSLVAGVSLIERLLTKIPGIYQMQIVQNERNKIYINIVKGTTFSFNTTMNQLKEEFEKAFPGTEMVIIFLPGIPQERSGKYRFAICNINHW